MSRKRGAGAVRPLASRGGTPVPVARAAALGSAGLPRASARSASPGHGVRLRAPSRRRSRRRGLARLEQSAVLHPPVELPRVFDSFQTKSDRATSRPFVKTSNCSSGGGSSRRWNTTRLYDSPTLSLLGVENRSRAGRRRSRPADSPQSRLDQFLAAQPQGQGGVADRHGSLHRQGSAEIEDRAGQGRDGDSVDDADVIVGERSDMQVGPPPDLSAARPVAGKMHSARVVVPGSAGRAARRPTCD